jgi:hypothetical protein
MFVGGLESLFIYLFILYLFVVASVLILCAGRSTDSLCESEILSELHQPVALLS